MGGNALKHLNPKRLTTVEVMNVYQRVATVARGLGTETHLVPWCFDKTEHGDVDILINDYNGFVTKIADRLGVENSPLHRKKNGDVTSLAVPIGAAVCQVDMIHTESHSMPHTRLYYSGGGLGMMLGRVADHYGFVFAQEGLRLRSDHSKPWSRDLFITGGPMFSLQILQYDELGAGAFETELDCWKYALSSPRAKPYMFLASQTNAENRSRDKQRPNHLRFQEWIKSNFSSAELTPLPKRSFEESLEEAELHHPGIKRDVEDQQREWEDKKRMNYVFGMGAVRENWPDMPAEQAGAIVRLMQKHLPDKIEREELWYNRLNHGWLLKMTSALAYKIGSTMPVESAKKEETK